MRDGDSGDGLAGVESERLVLIGIIETEGDVDGLARTYADSGVVERIVDNFGCECAGVASVACRALGTRPPSAPHPRMGQNQRAKLARRLLRQQRGVYHVGDHDTLRLYSQSASVRDGVGVDAVDDELLAHTRANRALEQELDGVGGG